MVYALMTSIGIAIGILVSNIAADNSSYLVTVGVLQVITLYPIGWSQYVSHQDNKNDTNECIYHMIV